MRAGRSLPPAPSQPLSAVSPLVRSFGDMSGVGGQSTVPTMPRPPDIFTTGAFGPGTPMWPMPIDDEDDDTLLPRRTQYPVWWNVPTGQPGSEGLGKLAPFGQLRFLADQYPVARKCIEDRKKEIIGLEWDVVPTVQAELAMSGSDSVRTDWQKRRGEVMDFLERPDRSPDSPYRNWADWMEALLEDRYVCDAVALYLHPPLGGRGAGILGSDIGSVDLLDGTTIRPLYDLRGGTPPPSTPAFQQYLWGVPRSDYATIAEDMDIDELPDYDDQFKYRELIYEVDHKRTWAPYGMSFIERALLPIQIGLARMNGQLQFWTEGSVPYMFVVPGKELISSPQQVRQLQNALNSIAGDTGFKQKIVVLPPGSTAEPMKPNPLADSFDELIIGLVAMQLGLSAQKLGIQIGGRGLNGSSGAGAMAKQHAQNEDDTWLEPETMKLKLLFNFLIQKVLGQTDMMWKWTGLDAPEDESQKTIDAIAKVQGSLISIDEGRENLGLDPIGVPETKVPLIFTATGAIAVTTAVQQGETQAQLAAEAPTPREQFEAQNEQAHAAINAKKPAADEVDDTPARSAAVANEKPKPKAPTSAKAQFSEIDTLGRLVAKGKPFSAFEPRLMSPGVYASIRDNMNRGLDQALDAGRQEVDREHREYVLKLAENVGFGKLDASILNMEMDRLASEGITIKLDSTLEVEQYLSKNYPAETLEWVRDCSWNRADVPLAEIDEWEPEKKKDWRTIKRMVGNLAEGREFDPIVVIKGSDGYAVADGRHRTEAARLASKPEIAAWVGTPLGKDFTDDTAEMHRERLNKAIAGEARHPVDTERLMHYWAEGEGAGKIGWGTPGDFDRCRTHLGKYVPRGDKLNGLCANLHHRATGAWPGHAAGEEHKAEWTLEWSEAVVADLAKRGIMIDAQRGGRIAESHKISEVMKVTGLTFREVLDLPLDLLETILKVGPKGYIHGWIFVGIPLEGHRVQHPHFGTGAVSRVRDFGNGNRSVNVKWDTDGGFTSHDAFDFAHDHQGERKPRFIPREEHEPKAPEAPKQPTTAEHEAAGGVAFHAGEDRVVPRNVLVDHGKEAAQAWYRGWDRENLNAPVPEPEAKPNTHDEWVKSGMKGDSPFTRAAKLDTAGQGVSSSRHANAYHAERGDKIAREGDHRRAASAYSQASESGTKATRELGQAAMQHHVEAIQEESRARFVLPPVESGSHEAMADAAYRRTIEADKPVGVHRAELDQIRRQRQMTAENAPTSPDLARLIAEDEGMERAIEERRKAKEGAEEEAFRQALADSRSGKDLRHAAADLDRQATALTRGDAKRSGASYDALHGAAAGYRKAADQKDADLISQYKLAERPKAGWRKLKSGEYHSHLAARMVENGLTQRYIERQAETLSKGREAHILHDGSIVSFKGKTIQGKTITAQDRQRVLDAVEVLRAKYPDRDPYLVTIGEAIAGGKFGSALAHARPGTGLIGVSNKVFAPEADNKHIASVERGWWMPAQAGHGMTKSVITHEFGHTLQPKQNGIFSDGGFKDSTRDALKAARLGGPVSPTGGISDYGRKNNDETYAEAFTEWELSGGKTQNAHVRAIAAAEGWV